MTISVFLLDDHEIVRRGVAQLLDPEPDLEVVGEAGNAAQALARIPAMRPDVAILDVRLPDGDGIDGLPRGPLAVIPRPACLMLTSFADDEALFGAIMAGAAGYLLKQINGTDLVDAVRAVAAGGRCSTRRDGAGPRAAAPRRRARRPEVRGAQPPGAPHPRPHRRRTDQPADRRRALPGREDGEELRVGPAAQARPRAAYRGGRLRRRTPPHGRTTR